MESKAPKDITAYQDLMKTYAVRLKGEEKSVSSEKTKHGVARRFWGRTIELALPYRIMLLVFVLASIASMSFCQLGFWPLSSVDGEEVYVLLVLGPLAMGAFAFGPLTGMFIGLFAGAVLFCHATFLPLDYYEIQYMMDPRTFLVFTVWGLVAGWAFSFFLRRNPSGVSRAVIIAGVCVALSLLASVLMVTSVASSYFIAGMGEYVPYYLLSNPLGVAEQAACDSVIMVVLCLAVDAVMRRIVERGSNRKLLVMFFDWMLVVSSVVFMLVSATIFSVTTIQAVNDSSEAMKGEVAYLANQIMKRGETGVSVLLEGYAADYDGLVAIVDENGVIMESNDERELAPGESFVRAIGYDDLNFDDGNVDAMVLGMLSDEKEAMCFQSKDEAGRLTTEFTYATAMAYDGGYVAMMRTPDLVYVNRFSTMASLTLLAVVLILASVALAVLLLRRVVVKRIDDTNSALTKITNGNLSTRVGVSDTAEFTSLSTGINTTVTALKDTIDEVKQRNAQDLATAKTIQESALPREFPPFPHIDKFDIYASMKTAKEVGGDFYNFFLIGDREERLGFLIADVSGKGIPAALFMMTAKTQLQNYMEMGIPLNEAVEAANHQLCIGNDAGMFVTAWVGSLDYKTGELTYVNCGHNPPMMLHDGDWKWVKDVSGLPLGLYDGLSYGLHTCQLESNDVLYLYTDGVTEAMNSDEELFGEDRLEVTLKEGSVMNPRSLGVLVRRALTEFVKGAEQSDDITMLILKYDTPPEKKAFMVLPAESGQLVHVCNFIHEELHRRNAPKPTYGPIDIAVEELFVNVCHYAYPDATPDDPGEVRIGFEYEGNPPSLVVTIADDGVPYDPLAKPDAVTPDDIEDVPIGGLGILMAKRSVDEMKYERVDGSNVVTLVKRW